jgi:hypothetical protein
VLQTKRGLGWSNEVGAGRRGEGEQADSRQTGWSGRQDDRVATQEFQATRPVKKALRPMAEQGCDRGKYEPVQSETRTGSADSLLQLCSAWQHAHQADSGRFHMGKLQQHLLEETQCAAGSGQDASCHGLQSGQQVVERSTSQGSMNPQSRSCDARNGRDAGQRHALRSGRRWRRVFESCTESCRRSTCWVVYWRWQLDVCCEILRVKKNTTR